MVQAASCTHAPPLPPYVPPQVPDSFTHPCSPPHVSPQVPGSSTEFFTEMHRCLRYSALGPMKSFTHHRLMLLEQKFNLNAMLNAGAWSVWSGGGG